MSIHNSRTYTLFSYYQAQNLLIDEFLRTPGRSSAEKTFLKINEIDISCFLYLQSHLPPTPGAASANRSSNISLNAFTAVIQAVRNPATDLA